MQRVIHSSQMFSTATAFCTSRENIWPLLAWQEKKPSPHLPFSQPFKSSSFILLWRNLAVPIRDKHSSFSLLFCFCFLLSHHNVFVVNAPGKIPLDFLGLGFKPRRARGCQWKSCTKQGIGHQDLVLGSDGISGVVTRQGRKADLDLVGA